MERSGTESGPHQNIDDNAGLILMACKEKARNQVKKTPAFHRKAVGGKL